MQKNSKPSTTQYTTSFMTALSIVIGSVIGVGIFFKNSSMIAWAHGNGALVIGSWVIGSLIAIGAAISFGLIAGKCKPSDSGIGQYAQEVVSEKYGWHTKLTWAFFYFPWLSTVCASYAAQYIMKVTTHDGDTGHTMVTILIIILLIVFFLSVNFFSEKLGSIFQISSMWIKLIPLFLLGIGVFVIVFIDPVSSSYWPSGKGTVPYDEGKASATNGLSPFLMLLFILPGTLFAFDSFLNAASLSETTKKKHLVWAIIGGMSFVAIVYVLVTVAIIHTGTLTAEDAIVKLFGGNPASEHLQTIFLWIQKIVRFIIIISAIGVVNGFSMVWIRTMKSVLKNKTRKNVILGIFFAWLISALFLIFKNISLTSFIFCSTFPLKHISFNLSISSSNLSSLWIIFLNLDSKLLISRKGFISILTLLSWRTLLMNSLLFW